MSLQRPQAFAGFLIVGLLALVGFAAFSATGVRTAPPIDLPDDVSARVAGAVLGLDLSADVEPADATTGSQPTDASTDSGRATPDVAPPPATAETAAPNPTAAPT